ncbi:(deoxy)nucleoside triphosphate pyrophosphohydrolase [Deferribacter autotrophicus]|nr:(deoxy)nucleoside triphosphate pyrophosphohydrolase [Deferribacter autotrophicus]
MKEVAAAIILDDEKRILLARRKTGEVLAGYWEFPGGKIEDGETPQQCIERELFEELNVKSVGKKILGEIIYHYNRNKIKLIGVLTDLIDKNFLLTVHDKILWVSSTKVLNYNLAPADVVLFQKIRRYIKNV